MSGSQVAALPGVPDLRHPQPPVVPARAQGMRLAARQRKAFPPNAPFDGIAAAFEIGPDASAIRGAALLGFVARLHVAAQSCNPLPACGHLAAELLEFAASCEARSNTPDAEEGLVMDRLSLSLGLATRGAARVLVRLMQARGELCTIEELRQSLRSPRAQKDGPGLLRVYLSHLRGALASHGFDDVIQTCPRLGYFIFSADRDRIADYLGNCLPEGMPGAATPQEGRYSAQGT